MNARRHRLYHRIQLAARLVRRSADREVARAADLTTAQAAVLSVLVETDGATQREIARRLGLAESAMTPMARRLERLGHVERRAHPDDARAWSLHATSAGRRALDALRPGFARVNRTIDAALTKAEAVRLAGLLEKLIEAFGERPEGLP